MDKLEKVDGKKYTQADDSISILERIWVDSITLGKYDSADNYILVDESVAEEGQLQQQAEFNIRMADIEIM